MTAGRDAHKPENLAEREYGLGQRPCRAVFSASAPLPYLRQRPGEARVIASKARKPPARYLSPSLQGPSSGRILPARPPPVADRPVRAGTPIPRPLPHPGAQP